MDMKRSVVWIAISMFLTTAVALSWASNVEAEEPYKVGAIFSVTGRASFLGEPEKKTAEMIAEEINKAGGINGHRLELIIYDDEGDATKCNVAMKKLINQDNVPVVIGPSTSGTSLAIVSVADKAQIPLISCAASKKIVMPVEKRHWVFKVAGSDIHVAQRIYDHMKSKGITKVGIMTGTTGFGASGREELLAFAKDYGITIVADERYGPKDTDLTAQLTKIKGTDAQAIVNWSVGQTQILAVKNWRALAMDKLPLYQSHGFGSRKNIELCGKDAEGVLCPLARGNIGRLLADDHIQKGVVMGYTEAYEKKYNEPISSFGGHAWDSLHIAVKALESVGPDRSKIRDFIENLTGFVGQHGVFNFSPRDHNGLSKDDLEMVVVKGGDWAIAK
ncbi:MAG: ABC transporter substrate-binding protein [Thermodesulfobacteriota bacterium]|nr:ABC transporter substrate-binding protein [Thermodesulfobacteriota bacterium]